MSSRDAVVTVEGTTICLSGEHDLFTADALSQAVVRAMAAGEGDLVVDLRDVEFMAVANVRVLLQAQALLRAQSRSIVLRSPSASAQRILVLCGVDDVFESNVAAGGGP